MIIEFIGVSGVGKTTIAKKYMLDRQNQQESIHWITYDLYEKYNWGMRNLIKLKSVIAFLFFDSKWVISYYLFLVKMGMKKENLLVTLFNGIYLKSIRRRVVSNEDYIFDEGIYHYLWAIILRCGKSVTSELILEIEDFFGKPDKLFVIFSEPSQIKKRLLKRGQYCKIMDSESLIEEIDKMQKEILKISDLVSRDVDVEIIHN